MVRSPSMRRKSLVSFWFVNFFPKLYWRGCVYILLFLKTRKYDYRKSGSKFYVLLFVKTCIFHNENVKIHKLHLYDAYFTILRNLDQFSSLQSFAKFISFWGRSQTTLTVFWLFFATYPFYWHFLWYERWQKWTFLEQLPTSSCKRSLWTPPYQESK